MTKPRYDFTACGTADTSAETKEMLHQLANAAGDRLTRDSEVWRRELIAVGWEEYRDMRTTWKAPTGELYRGPYAAWLEMRRRSGK